MAKKKYDISVIIPTYNYSHYIESCLRSVLSQRNVNCEIIVVNDGSTDETEAIINKYNRTVGYIYQANAGVSSARNNGAFNSKGKYLLFLDADDLIPNDYLSIKFEHLEKLEDRAISVSPTRLFTSLHCSGKPMFTGSWNLPALNLHLHLCRLNIAPPHSFLIPREAFFEIGGFAEEYHGCEDYDFWLGVLGAGFSFHSCNKKYCYYRRHQSSKGINKNKEGAYGFDVLVHLKKYHGKYGNNVRKVIECTEGMLALADGAIRTSQFINRNVNTEGLELLNELAENCIRNILEKYDSMKMSYSIESRLYTRRVISTLDRTDNLSAPLINCIRDLKEINNSRRLEMQDLFKCLPLNTYEKKSLLSYLYKSFILT
ncbi:glycosyltransferase family 2 protein [Desulfosediminicola sp.]|uniref:glycosyltransferase family 2 protein n=1 Tax=Desulfosediminicola sp. TaxID=2886825 RepID=UPI003AF1E313